MARYIDADALIEALQTDYDREGAKSDEMALNGLDDISVKYSHGQFCFLNAIDRVKNTPTADVVEVVRCKDCVHYRNHPNGLCDCYTEPYDNERGYKGDMHCVEPDDFCSYGERKE